MSPSIPGVAIHSQGSRIAGCKNEVITKRVVLDRIGLSLLLSSPRTPNTDVGRGVAVGNLPITDTLEKPIAGVHEIEQGLLGVGLLPDLPVIQNLPRHRMKRDVTSPQAVLLGLSTIRSERVQILNWNWRSTLSLKPAMHGPLADCFRSGRDKQELYRNC